MAEKLREGRVIMIAETHEPVRGFNCLRVIPDCGFDGASTATCCWHLAEWARTRRSRTRAGRVAPQNRSHVSLSNERVHRGAPAPRGLAGARKARTTHWNFVESLRARGEVEGDLR
jgi:hypothetical protein